MLSIKLVMPSPLTHHLTQNTSKYITVFRFEQTVHMSLYTDDGQVLPFTASHSFVSTYFGSWTIVLKFPLTIELLQYG